ncbi:hypothetical protein V8E54_005661 [Elaphomyces granulatus]
MVKIGVLPSTFHRSSHSAVDGRTLPLPGYKAETHPKSPMLTLLSKIGTLPFLPIYAGHLLFELLLPFAFELIGSKLEAS